MRRYLLLILILLNIGISKELLLSGSLASCSLGWIETRLVGPSFGIGMNVHKDFGVVVVCRTMEAWLTPWSGDVEYSIGVHALSPYLYFTKGIYTDKSMSKPALYFYFGGHYWRWPNENYVYSLKRYYQAGVGVKWTFYAFSPAFEIGFQKSQFDYYTDNGNLVYRDVVYWPQIKLTLELGGWWPIKLREPN